VPSFLSFGIVFGVGAGKNQGMKVSEQNYFYDGKKIVSGQS
jgi:hypothetical protein